MVLWYNYITGIVLTLAGNSAHTYICKARIILYAFRYEI